MAFNVNFYTFSKRHRSTAVPSGSGLQVTCHANEPLDVLAPEIILDWQQEQGLPTVYNYAHISDFRRWYRITGWRNEGGIWSAALQVDALASWRTEINTNSVYVYRSASSYDGDVVDQLYPTVARYRRLKISLPRMWSLDAATPSIAQGLGYFILGIIGDGQTKYYAFTQAQLETFLTAIYSPTYYNAVLGEFGAIEYPEAKVAIDPLQYISSIRYWPCGLMVPGTAWSLHTTGSVSSIPIGPVTVTATAAVFTAAGMYPDQTSYNTTYYDLDISGSDFLHPQADDRGDYMQLAPFTAYEIFYPPWGLIALSPQDLLEADYLRLRITADIRSGTAELTLSAIHTVNNQEREIIMVRSSAQVGIDCPLSHYVQPGVAKLGTLASVVGAGISLMTGNIGGALGGANAAIGSAVQGQIPHLSVVGSQASGSAMAGDPHLLVTHTYAANDDLAGRGRPLMAVRRLSTLSGYVMGDSDELAVACTEPELAEIRAALEGGMYLA